MDIFILTLVKRGSRSFMMITIHYNAGVNIISMLDTQSDMPAWICNFFFSFQIFVPIWMKLGCKKNRIQDSG